MGRTKQYHDGIDDFIPDSTFRMKKKAALKKQAEPFLGSIVEDVSVEQGTARISNWGEENDGQEVPAIQISFTLGNSNSLVTLTEELAQKLKSLL